MDNVTNLANPAVVGPGVWFSIHLKAKNATTHRRKEDFIEYMNMLSEEFPCIKCRKHIQAYLKENSFDNFYNMTDEDDEDIGLFKWTWIFHNTVNNRLGKPYIDWETAWSMYDEGDMICSQECDESSDEILTIPITELKNIDPIDSIDSNEDIINMRQRSLNKEKIITGFNTPTTNNIIQSYFLNKGMSKVLNEKK